MSTTVRLAVAPKSNEVGATSVLTSSKLLPLANVKSDAPESVLAICRAALADIDNATAPPMLPIATRSLLPVHVIVLLPPRGFVTDKPDDCPNTNAAEPPSGLLTLALAELFTKTVVEPDKDLIRVTEPDGVMVMLAEPAKDLETDSVAAALSSKATVPSKSTPPSVDNAAEELIMVAARPVSSLASVRALLALIVTVAEPANVLPIDKFTEAAIETVDAPLKGLLSDSAPV